MTNITPNKSYFQLITNLKTQIQSARIKAHLAVNRELVLLYFKIGKSILEKQKEEGWGSKIVEQVSRDLRKEFPEMKGLSTTNLFYMRRFAEICQQTTDELQTSILQAPLGELITSPFFSITWYHNIALMDQLSSNDQRLWYAEQTIKNGWSRNVLMHQIKSDLYKRQKTAIKSHNFDSTLPQLQSDLAKELLKDEYNFDFLANSNLKERDLENHLTDHIVKFLLELGKGFAFIGKQYELSIGGQAFFTDLLFYNIELRCFIVIELKTGEFKPEYTKLSIFTLILSRDF